MTWALLPAVAVAGAVGAVLRHAVVQATARWRLPYGVLIVNAAGSLAAGVLVGVWQGLDPGFAQVALTGFCGGLTTFSTLSVDTVRLAVERGRGVAALNVAGNLAVGFAAVAVGVAIGRAW